MPQFKGEKLEKVYLPSTANEANDADKAWVVLDINVKAAAIVGLKSKDAGEAGIHLLARAIKDWNFDDGQGQKVEINPDNVAKLDFSDYGYLNEILHNAAVTQTAGVAEDLKEI